MDKLISFTEAQRPNQTPREQSSSLPNALFVTSVHIPRLSPTAPTSWKQGILIHLYTGGSIEKAVTHSVVLRGATVGIWFLSPKGSLCLKGNVLCSVENFVR